MAQRPTALPQIYEFYAGRNIKRVYVTPDGAAAFGVQPDANGRLYFDTSMASVESIYVQSGWIVVQAGSAARQRVYVNPEHVAGITWDTDSDLPEA